MKNVFTNSTVSSLAMIMVFAGWFDPGNINAQPYYGEFLYTHLNNTRQSSGIQTMTSPGFLLGGYVPFSVPGVPNFYLDKLDPDGSYSLSGTAFVQEYFVFADNGCSLIPPQIGSCVGISAMEYSASPMEYAVAGAYDDGCFFASLDAAGNVINSAFYAFPAFSFGATKPLLVEAGGLFYIIGSYLSSSFPSRHFYVAQVTSTGSFVQSFDFDMDQPCTTCPCSSYGYDLIPYAAIMSPYASAYGVSQELIIVGDARKYGLWGPNCTSNAESSGFFFRLDAASLSFLSNNFFDYSNIGAPTSGVNAFNSIAIDNSMSTPGFVIGGYTDYDLSLGQSWMLSVDPGANINWSTLLWSPYDPGATNVTGVAHRLSSVYGDTYYGAMQSSAGALVGRLDATGSAFTAASFIDNVNEFNYLAAGGPVFSNLISFDNIAGNINEGIHVYGEDANADYYLALAAFNGYTDFSNCTSSSTNNTLFTSAGPTGNTVTGITETPNLLVQCPNAYIANGSTTVAITTACFINTLPPPASNNKTEDHHEPGAEGAGTNLFPNPASDMITLELTVDEDRVSIALFNSLGQNVSTVLDPNNVLSGKQIIHIDLEGLNLCSGIYILRVNINDTVTEQKIVYQKN